MYPKNTAPRDSAGGPSHLTIRECRAADLDAMLAIINSAAEAYRGVIPSDCWREPYMSAAALNEEIAARVDFSGCDIDGALTGVMGVQHVRNVTLIRHAYVAPAYQVRGIGSVLLTHLRTQTDRPILIGTWTAAAWAIRFYERHGFALVPEAIKPQLLRTYWTVSERQIETSVVLAAPALTSETATGLMTAAMSA